MIIAQRRNRGLMLKEKYRRAGAICRRLIAVGTHLCLRNFPFFTARPTKAYLIIGRIAFFGYRRKPLFAGCTLWYEYQIFEY
jgi:hypothetical protein